MKYSVSEENYIKAIYHLQQETDRVNTMLLASTLHAKPASITDMMKKLKTKKLLDYKPYYGFKLSAEGNRVALGIVRRHRLWEFFLAEKLNFNWEEVHEMAEDLEHVSNKKLIDKLDAFLGYPKFDPHGDPIPDQEGKLQKEDHALLSSLKIKSQGKVTKIKNHSMKIMDLIAHQHIKIVTKIAVKQIFDFDSSMEIAIDGKHTTNISQQLANNIYIGNDRKKGQ